MFKKTYVQLISKNLSLQEICKWYENSKSEVFFHLLCVGTTQSNQNVFVFFLNFLKNENKNEKFVLPKAAHYHAFQRPFFKFKKEVILTPG